jgi:hypothetical protein
MQDCQAWNATQKDTFLKGCAADESFHTRCCQGRGLTPALSRQSRKQVVEAPQGGNGSTIVQLGLQKSQFHVLKTRAGNDAQPQGGTWLCTRWPAQQGGGSLGRPAGSTTSGHLQGTNSLLGDELGQLAGATCKGEAARSMGVANKHQRAG